MTLTEFFNTVPPDLRISVLRHMLLSASDGDKSWRLFDRLLRYGCPFESIVRTLDDMFNDSERDAIREMLGSDFNITFEGEE